MDSHSFGAIQALICFQLFALICTVPVAGQDLHNSPQRQLIHTQPFHLQDFQTELLVAGGSTAAYTAVLAALREGVDVVFVSPTHMIGGQFTSQGLMASDDSDIQRRKASAGQLAGERFGFSESQADFRERVRQLHWAKYPGTQTNLRKDPDNPGDCWVADLCGDPMTTLQAMEEALQTYASSGQLRMIYEAVPTMVATIPVNGRTNIDSITFNYQPSGADFRVFASVVLEGTDLGDLIEMANLPSRVGQEARATTGESPLPTTACGDCQQAFTYIALLQRTKGSSAISKPNGWGINPWLTNYSGALWNSSGVWVPFFNNWSIFDYRRAVSLGGTGDVSMINWGCQNTPSGLKCGNDYFHGNLVGVSAATRSLHLQRARDRTLGYLYHLQASYGQSTPASALTGTADGIAIEPYIRESRRGIAYKTMVHGESAKSAFNLGYARGLTYADTVGIGHYHYFDFHSYDGNPLHVDLVGDEVTPLPFTISMKSLIPLHAENLILSAKNLGTTHITSAAYRMHPVEWHIGEAGGTLAAMVINANRNLHTIANDTSSIRELQMQLARRGNPLLWIDDVARDHPDFEAIHALAAAKVFFVPSNTNLRFLPNAQITRAQIAEVVVKALQLQPQTPATATFVDVPTTHWAFSYIETLAHFGIVSGTGNGAFSPNQNVQRLHTKFIVANASNNANLNIPGPIVDQAFQGVTLSGFATRAEVARIFYRLWRYRMNYSLSGPMSWGQ